MLYNTVNYAGNYFYEEYLSLFIPITRKKYQRLHNNRKNCDLFFNFNYKVIT